MADLTATYSVKLFEPAVNWVTGTPIGRITPSVVAMEAPPIPTTIENQVILEIVESWKPR